MSGLSLDEREALVAFIGERPSTVLSVHALLSGTGRVWVAGLVTRPDAVLVESRVVPGEPQGFGDPVALLALLEIADGWWCIESTFDNTAAMAGAFDARWGLARRVVDIIHVVGAATTVPAHPLVRALAPGEPSSLRLATPHLFADLRLAEAAAAVGYAFAAVDEDTILGHGSCLAWGREYADIGIHVAEPYRRAGIATAGAARACAAVTASGLAPIWGCNSENSASRRVAEKLGFVEEARVMFLVRES